MTIEPWFTREMRVARGHSWLLFPSIISFYQQPHWLNYHEQQVRFWSFCPLQQCELLRPPGIREGLGFVDVLQRK
jgi:hypothetical protein